ncbi:AMP-binding protein [Streptomyces sp. NPDC004629]|uniref:AMP-binding protein n=1 Tax=Streptomyces sp. NPDC004629 TaxID=3364705 RepID=UPI00368B01BD
MAHLSTSDLRRLVDADGDLRRLVEDRAERYADATFLRFGSMDLSYGEIDSLADRAAQGLIADGIGRGDAVAIMMRNSPDWLAVWFGAIKIGAMIVPVNVALRGDGLVHVLNDSRAALVVVDADLLPQLQTVLRELAHVRRVVVREAGGRTGHGTGHTDIREFLDRPSIRPPVLDLRSKDPATILYTSGTTGPAKGCLLPHGQYIAASHQMAINLEYDTSDTLYSCLPLFHINAQNYSVLSAWTTGATMAMDATFTASGFWRRIIDTGATSFNIIGSIPQILWNQPPSELDRKHKARVAFGVPVPLEIWEQWEERFGVRIVYAYGMTENGLPTLFPYANTPAPAHLRGSGGQASASAEVAIVDDNDDLVPAGTVGEIATRPKIANTMMLEYFGQPKTTVEATRNSWFHTGDLGYLDEDGYLFYVDRKKDAMRRRGEMVSSWDVESVVLKHPLVADCAAYGVPSPLGEEEIMITVVTEQGTGFEPTVLLDFCRERMAPFQLPRYIRVVESLPRTQTQRVEKYKLRAEGITADTWDATVVSQAAPSNVAI